MLIQRDREKLLNALIYFSENVMYAGKTKLYKLLNFLDFLHFEKTGRSVTGLKYFALEMGPVPLELQSEWSHPKSDFRSALRHQIKVLPGNKKRFSLKPLKKFDESVFSPFEFELIQRLAKKHFKDNAEDMSEFSHFETGPWHEVWEEQNAHNQEIPYDLVLLRRGSDKDLEILDLAKEHEEIKNNYAQ